MWAAILNPLPTDLLQARTMLTDKLLQDLLYEGFIDRKRIVYRYYSDAPGFAVAYNRAKVFINYLCKNGYIKYAYPYGKFLLTIKGFVRAKSKGYNQKLFYREILEKIPENKLEHSLIANDSRWWLSQFHPEFHWITEHFRPVNGFSNEAFIPDFIGVNDENEFQYIGEVIRTHCSSKALQGKLRVYNDFFLKVPRIWVCIKESQVHFCRALLAAYPGVTNTKVILYNSVDEKTLFDPTNRSFEIWKSLPKILN